MHWYAVRVTYGRELKFQKLLEEAGFRTFIAMCRKKIVKDGHTEVKVVPAVSNLCFVYCERSALAGFMSDCGETCPARFIWDSATNAPVIVPEKAMEDFIKVSLVMSDDVLYFKDVSGKLRAGQKVRVKDGPFKGVEGVVARIRRSRRIVVELLGILAVATTFVHPRDLEIL